MQHSSHLGALTADDWNRLQDLLDRFEQAWAGAEFVDLAEFLPPAADALRPVVLQEMVRSELEIRWRRGQSVLVEEYLRRFPELNDAAQLPSLIHWEYRIRQRHGDRPALDPYQVRFPKQFAELRRLVETQVPVTPTTPLAPPPAAPASMPLPQRLAVLPVGGGYKLLRRLGNGTFGEVWHAEAPGGVDVAVKIVLRPLEHADRKHEQEALEAIKHLRHVFLLQTQAFFSLEDRLIIVMELADGSLRDRLKTCTVAGQQGIPPPELLVYMREACQALDYLHGKRVLHRDIKPDNLLFSEQHVKLADLGLARMLEAQRSFAATTCGSPAYMAPEVWRGNARAQSDQYSLAVTYVHLRLNRLPFEGGGMAQLMMAHAEEVPNLAPLSEGERHVLLRALAKSPAQRYGSCREFAQALEAALLPLLAPALTEEGATATRRLQPDASSAPDRTRASTQRDAPVVVASTVPAPPPAPVTASTRQSWRTPTRKEPRPHGLPHLIWLPVALTLLAATSFVCWLILRGPAPKVVSLPPGFVADEGATVEIVEGKEVYSRIVRVLDDGTRVPFVLMLHTDRDDPAPFYMMHNKVSNRVFRRYAAAHPEDLHGSDWSRGGIDAHGDDLTVTEERLDFPVFRVKVDLAHQCARWLGGELPTAEQWDKAGGRFAGAVGPFTGVPDDWSPGDFALKPQGPMAVGKATRDESCFHCRDMASNGYEWTRTTCLLSPLKEDGIVPFDTSSQDLYVALRGMTYLAPRQFTFEKLAALEPQRRFEASEEIGFRVAIDVPDR